MKRAITIAAKILLVPIIVPFWFAGWFFYYIGKKQAENRTLKRERILHDTVLCFTVPKASRLEQTAQ